MIPKRIHQIWIGNKPAPVDWMASWSNKNSDYSYFFWNENSLASLQFVNQKLVDQIQDLNGKCDVMRYEILYQFGGIFCDADTECINPLDDFLLDNDFFSCYEHERMQPGQIAVSTMGCVKSCQLMKLAIEELHVTEYQGEASWVFCGPKFLTNLIIKHNYMATIYPSYYFLPVHGTGHRYEGDGKVYCNHYWGSTHGLYDNSSDWHKFRYKGGKK